jgi:hypothetical protein
MARVSSGIRRLIAVVLGGLAGLAGLVALVVLFNDGLSLVGCTAATPLGWTVPLVSAVVIGAMAWALLSQPEKDTGDGDEFASVSCHVCGRAVLAKWRMCPYCGSAGPSVTLEQDGPVTPE